MENKNFKIQLGDGQFIDRLHYNTKSDTHLFFFVRNRIKYNPIPHYRKEYSPRPFLFLSKKLPLNITVVLAQTSIFPSKRCLQYPLRRCLYKPTYLIGIPGKTSFYLPLLTCMQLCKVSFIYAPPTPRSVSQFHAVQFYNYFVRC